MIGLPLEILFFLIVASSAVAKFHQLLVGHLHVVSVHGVYEDDDALHLVLNFCPNLDVFDQITACGGPFLEVEAVAVMQPLMEVITPYHRQGVAHATSSCPFNSRGRLRLADFGSVD
ncbi:hypothetical protein Taro_055059 [Colocasia esculenta]|uniref:Protein kinase domain-containing protein n=1 Tax=Colocasia esculenta TaxID=4460 RepID=A0A843XS78_COLES|nr:hypothetical protein [Colocasia esculenta]